MMKVQGFYQWNGSIALMSNRFSQIISSMHRKQSVPILLYVDIDKSGAHSVSTMILGSISNQEIEYVLLSIDRCSGTLSSDIQNEYSSSSVEIKEKCLKARLPLAKKRKYI